MTRESLSESLQEKRFLNIAIARLRSIGRNKEIINSIFSIICLYSNPFFEAAIRLPLLSKYIFPLFSIDQIILKDGFLVIVEFDMIAYMKKHNSRAIKKTLSIPAWMNEAATSLGLNFSQILQEALLQKIQNS